MAVHTFARMLTTLLLCLLAPVVVEASAYPTPQASSTFSTMTSTITSIPQNQGDNDEAKEHQELKLRADCPVPCGWKSWLCCAANEICYTAPNLEAACSPTALPSIDVEISIVVYTSTLKATKIVTKTLSFSDTAKHSDETSLVTLTSVETSTITYSTPFSRPTATGLQDGNSTEDALTRSGMPIGEQVGIGLGVGIVVVAAIAGIIWFYCCKDRRPKKHFSDSQDDDGSADSYNPQNFAQIQDRNSSRRRPLDEIAQTLGPRQSFMRSGADNPYTQDQDVAAPPYVPVPSPRPAGQYGASRGRGQQGYGMPQANVVPPRRPVGQ